MRPAHRIDVHWVHYGYMGADQIEADTVRMVEAITGPLTEDERGSIEVETAFSNDMTRYGVELIVYGRYVRRPVGVQP